MPDRNYAAVAERYAQEVVSGKIAACRWVCLACQRHLDDLKASKRKDYPYRFDAEAARKVCAFIELLPHVKGKWASKRELLALAPWQVFKTAVLFGWLKKADGNRRFRRAVILEPRKNGKSAWAAGVGLYMFALDGEHGSEVYSGATSEKQAWEVFRPAKSMAAKTPALLSACGITVNASNLHMLGNESRFEPMIGKPGDGSSPHCAIIDEYHEHETDDMVSTMETGMGAREQALLLIITTAGTNVAGPCYQAVVEARRMLEGITDDPETFSLMYGIDPPRGKPEDPDYFAGDDWTKPETLKKANPNFDVSVRGEFLLSQQRDAINNARKASAFRTKHLNEWVFAKEAYFNIAKWMASAEDGLRMEDFAGQPCTVGLDLASKVDIAAAVFLFRRPQGGFAAFGKFYLPEKTIELEATGNYVTWERAGRLIKTEGDMIDHEKILEDIVAASKVYTIDSIGYDPAQATMLITAMMKENLPVVEFRHTVMTMSEPMKEVEALIRSQKIAHDGDPCFAWQIGNVVTKRDDPKDNVYPRKERAENKIDGAVALIMAMGRQLVGADQPIDVMAMIA
ncbi:terminase TerL endonuclease subunit [Methylopila sp. 73B]|uniref:terminase large subunit n=1 Tax=Methylopila sp. 73B TaxID=1120792 RepID=UPI000371BB8B|nr:terminase TerL endonuclease subunit [Methylopila sp. 73B]